MTQMKRTTGTVVTKFLKERLKTEYMNSTNTRVSSLVPEG